MENGVGFKENSLAYQKKRSISIAKQLFYPKEVIKKLEKAKTINELSRILKDARCSY